MGFVTRELAERGLADALREGNSEARIGRGLITLFASDEDREQSLEEWAAATGFALACQTDKGLAPEVDYMALRRDEDAAALARLGVRGEHLGLLEAPHRGYDSPAALFAGRRAGDDVAGAVTEALGADRDRTDALVTVAVLIVGYYTGGYVAGRLARFDGARNGFLSWVVGLLATLALAVFGMFVGAQYDVLSRIQLPTLPAAFGQVTIANLVLLAVAITGTLVAAVLGGKAGEGFHRRVDRAAAKAI